MKPFLTSLLTIAITVGSTNAAPPTRPRTLTDINVISPRVLQRSISPKFYKSLLISPIEGWIVVRAKIAGTHLSGIRLIHSELNGAYDDLALKMAKEQQILGAFTVDSPHFGSTVLVHLLIYQIADGTMVLSFPTLEEPGGNQMEYFGCSRLSVLKRDGTWTEIEGPPSLHRKGWAVRQGMKNKMEAFLKMEMKRVPLDK
jgi:hypothetical protein